ncbi:SRPBCC family protein [Nonomuraea sp. NPDC050536]|uniref:SRPBCC family protein n=1 Tax=Nonomuraea sp. NPDC050536 TaxID=3364366 RepID=UPI0037C9A56E
MGYVYTAAQQIVAAPPERVFALVTDWPRHREWMFMTDARQVAPGRVEAYTGLRPFGFLDTMTITRWEPPHVLVVEHTGRLVRGLGVIRVLPHPAGSRIIWAERLEPPLGPLGHALWPLARAVARPLARRSLRTLAELLS